MKRRPGTALAVLIATCFLACASGCTNKPAPWREDRQVTRHFFVKEWLLGADQRAVPIEESFVELPEDGQWPPLGEPHGPRVLVTRARLYAVKNGDRKFVKSYGYFLRNGLRVKEDVRLWPSPDGRKLAVQRVWRDGPIEIVDAQGDVSVVPETDTKDFPPTFRDYPFGFVQWAEDSRHIVAVSIHTHESRGYTYVAKWRIDIETGERELLSETLLLLSDQVADWKLIPIPIQPSLAEIADILRPFEASEEDWVRRATLENLARVLRKLAEGEE